MKAGTKIRLPDGRKATVVYHGLDGYGVVWGWQTVNIEAIMESCPLFEHGPKQPECPEPEAMLRESYETAELPCVGGEYEIVEEVRSSE